MEPSGRLGNEEHDGDEHDAPEELHADGDTPRERVVGGAGGGGPGDSVRDDNSENDVELVARDDRAANVCRRGFTEVKRAKTRERTDTETGNDTTDDDLSKRCLDSSLNERADGEEEGPDHHRVLSADGVGYGSLSERADECADGEEGGDERSVVRRQRAEPFAAEAVVEIGHDETATDDTDVY